MNGNLQQSSLLASAALAWARGFGYCPVRPLVLALVLPCRRKSVLSSVDCCTGRCSRVGVVVGISPSGCRGSPFRASHALARGCTLLRSFPRTCRVGCRPWGARTWGACTPKESNLESSGERGVKSNERPEMNTYGFLAIKGRPHWAGILVRTRLPRTPSPAILGSLAYAGRKGCLHEAAGGSGASHKE